MARSVADTGRRSTGRRQGILAADWAHTNAVVMDDSERYVIASPRYQDAVVKIDLETSELVWILGNHDDWGPEWQDFLLETER